MTTVCLQLSFAAEAQKITLSEKNATLEKIFKEIRTQTGYDFFCDIAILKDAKKVNIQVKDVSIEEALNYCFANQGLSYSINNKIVVVQKQETQLRVQFMDMFLSGVVVDEKGMPLPGATITVKGTRKTTLTDDKGVYKLRVEPTDILVITYLGYITREVKVSDSKRDVPFLIKLSLNTNKLQQVEITSTGYQDLPKERATGSFEVITAKQLEHSTNTNLIKRLEGITTSMDFNNQLQPNLSTNPTKKSPIAVLTIRGKNSLIPTQASLDLQTNSGQPLVVIDGIASPYSIDNINPNDVESINILKDAAAASIWGSRASNGVIVIKTKRGGYDRPTTISFNSNVNITDKIDLFYKKYMSTSDFIDAQVSQLNFLNTTVGPPDLFQPQPVISPIAEIWNSWKLGTLTTPQYNAALDSLRGNDIRRDYDKYLLRKTITQSYSLGVDGGSNRYAYRLSGGYDQTQNNSVASDNNRINVNYSASLKPLKNLDLQAVIGYTQLNTKDQAGPGRVTGVANGGAYFPYNRLADDQGNPLPVITDFRPAFLKLLSDTYGDKILDMQNRPLENIKEGYFKTKSQGVNINLNANYKISSVFSAGVTYSYNWGLNEQAQLLRQNSYYMRQLINRFTSPAADDAVVPGPGELFPTPFKRNIPLGGFYSTTNAKSNNQTLRGQLNANKTWNEKHVLSAIAGIDANQNYTFSRADQFYGYNEKTLSTSPTVPYGAFIYTLYNDVDFGFNTAQIPYTPGLSDLKFRSYSFYSNAAYTYDKRYTVSGSVRKDVSSVFGQTTNRKGSPYYSAGASWSVNNEKFYHLDWLPYLQIRATFGYNGNVNASITSVPLLSYSPQPGIGNSLLYATTTSATNPQLRPEKTAMVNLGLNFGTRNNRLSGSLEYYIRKTTDLITTAAMDPSTSFNMLTFNTANLRSTGTDLNLNSLNLQTGSFSWTTNLLFSHNMVTVTKLFSSNPNTAFQAVEGTSNYTQGKGISRLFAYRWAGLDPQTGDPMGYVNGQPVRVTGDATVLNLIKQAPASEAHYFGSSTPTYFGAFRNNFNYREFSFSVNFQYKFGYYFRRSISDEVRYAALFNNNTLSGGEFSQRWQKPGDEKTTNVPSLIFPVTGTTQSRDFFYYYSDINVLKGDHIRLQEINLSYTFKNTNWIIKNPRIYANVNNLGIIWRANKLGLDPDINDYPMPRTYSFGLSASF